MVPVVPLAYTSTQPGTVVVKPLYAYPANTAVTGPRGTVNVAGSAEFDLKLVALCHHNVSTPTRDDNLFVLGYFCEFFVHLILSKATCTLLAMGTISPGSDV